MFEASRRLVAHHVGPKAPGVNETEMLTTRSLKPIHHRPFPCGFSTPFSPTAFSAFRGAMTRPSILPLAV